MKNIIRLLKSKVNLPGRIGSCFTDIRHKPQIPLTHIITSIFLMPIVGLRSFLALDNKSRQSPFRFGIIDGSFMGGHGGSVLKPRRSLTRQEGALRLPQRRKKIKPKTK